MAKQKLSVNSVQSLNMNNTCYMKLHRRMYLIWNPQSGVPATLHLDLDLKLLSVSDNEDFSVSIELFDEAATDFLHYEMPFDDLLLLYSTLCIKYGKLQIPF